MKRPLLLSRGLWYRTTRSIRNSRPNMSRFIHKYSEGSLETAGVRHARKAHGGYTRWLHSDDGDDIRCARHNTLLNASLSVPPSMPGKTWTPSAIDSNKNGQRSPEPSSVAERGNRFLFFMTISRVA